MLSGKVCFGGSQQRLGNWVHERDPSIGVSGDDRISDAPECRLQAGALGSPRFLGVPALRRFSLRSSQSLPLSVTQQRKGKAYNDKNDQRDLIASIRHLK